MKPVPVAVVSDNAGTLEGLCEYLQQAGVSVIGTRVFDDPIVRRANVVVCFPDDYGSRSMIDAMTRLARARPTVRFVLVTGEPRSFKSVARANVIPKPAWGWTILDAVRDGRAE